MNEGFIAKIKADARQYPGSCELGLEGRKKIEGQMISYIAYTNPQNTTSYAYIEYGNGWNSRGISKMGLDIWDRKQIEDLIEYEIKYKGGGNLFL